MQALKAVKRNRGAGGIDRMTTEELEPHLQAHGWILKDKIVKGTYVGTPVRRVEIPKPSGGTRMLGIPTVQDRYRQQLLLQDVALDREIPAAGSHGRRIGVGYRGGNAARWAAVSAAGEHLSGCSGQGTGSEKA